MTKYPLVLNRTTPALAYMVGQLRHLAAARGQWASDLEGITPSLMAFFLKDFGDQVRRTAPRALCMLSVAYAAWRPRCWQQRAPPRGAASSDHTHPGLLTNALRCAAWSTWRRRASPRASTCGR